MRRFQVLMLLLLTVIAVELGLLTLRLPTPIAHAGPSAPAPALQDPHDILRTQLDRVEKGLAEVQRELATNRQQTAALAQQTTALTQKMDKDHADAADSVKTILSYRRNWYRTCTAAGNLLSHFMPESARNLGLGVDDLCQPQK